MSASGGNPGGGDRRGKGPEAREISEHEISRRAYEKWESEGRPHGRDKDHWHEAERELAGDDPAASASPNRAERRGDGAKRQTPPGLGPGAPAAATATGGTTATAKAAAKKSARTPGSASGSAAGASAGSGTARGQKPS